MDRHPDDVTAADDLALVQAARTGDRLAFGGLYLRHHAAAWRMACVASRFSPDAELAVIEGFTRVFSALPTETEEFETGAVTFRPYLLACVRQAALDRAKAAGRAEGPGHHRGVRPQSPPVPAALAGLGADGEVVLSSLEHHVARGALAALPERFRTALWLSDVEAMTPGEVADILGTRPQEVADLTARARAQVRAGREAALGRHEVRADCRFTVANLDLFATGSLDPAKGVLVRSHLDLCPPCRMRFGELANAPATLAAAVPTAPLLGGETQHHWLTSVDDIHPADRLLPPGLAAAAPAHRLSDVFRWAGPGATRRRVHAPDPSEPTTTPNPAGPPGWTEAPGRAPTPTPPLPPAWTVPAGRATPPRRRDRRTRPLPLSAGLVPVVARRAGRAVWPALPATFLVVAWLGVMLALPNLMTPATAPGPEGLALPAVQAYVPGYLPGADRSESARRAPAAPPAVDTVVADVASEVGAAAAAALQERAAADSAAQVASAGPPVKLIPTVAVLPPSGPLHSPPGEVSVPSGPPAAGIVAAAAPVTVAPPMVTAVAAAAPIPGTATKPRQDAQPRQDAKGDEKVKPGKELKPRERDRKRAVSA